MKRTLLLLLLLVAFGAYLYIRGEVPFFEVSPFTTEQQASLKTAKPVAPETKKLTLSRLPALFPSGPMIWIHSKDLGKIVKQVKKSNFYKQAVEYKIFNPSKPLPVSFGTKTKGENFFSGISSQLEEKIMMDLMGQEIGLAFYPPEKQGTSNYLFAAQISSITKIQEKLQRVKASLLGDQVTVSESSYKEKTIITYKNQEQKYSFHYVITKDQMLGSSSDILLKKGIDLMDGKEGDRFINSEGFNSLFKTSDFSMPGLLFADVERIIPNISNNVIPSKNISPKTVDNTKKELQSFKYLGITFKIQKGLEIKGVLTINEKKAGQKLLQMIKVEPRKLKSLNFMPGSLVIYGANIFEPALFFEQFIKVFEKKAAEKTFTDFFSEYTGVDLEKDIIPSIGNEIFYSVSVQDKTASSQIPGITIGLEIKDREKINSLLKKIQTSLTKSSNQKSFPGESYEGYDINFLSIPILKPTRLVYSIVDNFLFLSLNQKEIKRLIDTSKKKIPPLEKSRKYLSANIPAKNNGMFFINTSLLWDSLSEGVTKAPVSLSLASSGQSIEKGIKSLDLMRVVQSFNSVFMYKNNQINSRTLIGLKDIPKVRTSKELVAFLEKSKQKIVPRTLTKPIQAQKASYIYVYNPFGKRDPFRSLMQGRQAIKKAGQAKAYRFAQFIKNVEALEPINLHFYKKIKRKDPVLYKKLKSHARFFKNKKAVKQVSEEERIQKLEQYKELISLAKINFHDTITGPLQSSQYSSLTLAGVIWGSMGSTALIETKDGRGYSVKVNDLVGPNYGVVKSIEKGKLIVVEKYINYIGKITEKRREIKLNKSEGSI